MVLRVTLRYYKALRVFLQDIKSHELLRYIVVLQERRGNTRGDNWLNMAKQVKAFSFCQLKLAGQMLSQTATTMKVKR